MSPTRRPGSKVSDHVREPAKHWHRDLDFIFVSQSPAKQVDEFVHDLIERHIHVRRRLGLPFAHLRIFDHFERNPEKASPLILKRVKLPKRPMGLRIHSDGHRGEEGAVVLHRADGGMAGGRPSSGPLGAVATFWRHLRC